MSGPVDPTVTVVIPTYGHAHTVEETLESVFRQRFRDYEIVVVDDGSPDDTAAVLAPFVRSGRIRYLHQSNQGQGAARNRGLAEARGRYVAFLDDDDLWQDDSLAWQVEALDAHDEAVLAYGDHRTLRPDGELQTADRIVRPSGRVYEAFRRRNWMVSPGQALMRRSALGQVGGFDPTVWGSDDWDLYIRLARVGEFIYRKRPVLVYRDHPAAASRRALLHVRNHLEVVRRHIGWNLPLLVRHQWAAGGYFVPRLLRYAREQRAAGALEEARTAALYALAFRPTLVFRPSFLAELAGAEREAA
ncbi:MAG: glycosyltransferase family A protein [Gemmatimonadota bacterium]